MAYFRLVSMFRSKGRAASPSTVSAAGQSALGNGNIEVLTNWNLGAEDANGNALFRFNGIAPHITFRAGGNVQIDASTALMLDQKSAYLWTTGYVPQLDTYIGPETPNPLFITALLLHPQAGGEDLWSR
jgi:hypothetical protein